MVLGALGCMNNVDFGGQIVNDNIVLDVFIRLCFESIINRLNSSIKKLYLILVIKIRRKIKNLKTKKKNNLKKKAKTSKLAVCTVI